MASPGVVGRLDDAAVSFEQRVGGAADPLVGVDHQHLQATQPGPLSGPAMAADGPGSAPSSVPPF